jgi:hypothetical protein
MNDMFDLFWTSLDKLDFMPSWKNVNFIKLKWNSSAASILKMVYTWVLIRFKPLWIGLPQLLFMMFNFFLVCYFLLTFHYTLFHNRGPSYSFNSEGSTFSWEPKSWNCLPIFEGFLHNYPILASCKPFQIFFLRDTCFLFCIKSCVLTT